jgi:hypothetical protein
VTLPLLTGGRQRANETIARAQLEAEKARYDLAVELADRDARTAWAQLVAAESTWQAGISTVNLARRAYEIGQIRFRAGVSTQLELSDARFQLETAESNHAQAARNLQVARIRVALLPELPVSEGAAPSMPPALSNTPVSGSPITLSPAAAPSVRTQTPGSVQPQLPGRRCCIRACCRCCCRERCLPRAADNRIRLRASRRMRRCRPST